jgi:hypothetical protein
MFLLVYSEKRRTRGYRPQYETSQMGYVQTMFDLAFVESGDVAQLCWSRRGQEGFEGGEGLCAASTVVLTRRALLRAPGLTYRHILLMSKHMYVMYVRVDRRECPRV